MPTPRRVRVWPPARLHERLMLANMATSLFQNGRITTTLPKAKRLRPLAERLITLAKRGDLHNRRRVMRVIRNKSVVHKLFTEIAEQMEQREGGYTRIVKDRSASRRCRSGSHHRARHRAGEPEAGRGEGSRSRNQGCRCRGSGSRR